MLNKTEQSDRAANPNEAPEDCYRSALPKGSGLCLPCYTRWLGGERPSPANRSRRMPLFDSQRGMDVPSLFEARSLAGVRIERMPPRFVSHRRSF
jgi:hypothetical protein